MWQLRFYQAYQRLFRQPHRVLLQNIFSSSNNLFFNTHTSLLLAPTSKATKFPPTVSAKRPVGDDSSRPPPMYRPDTHQPQKSIMSVSVGARAVWSGAVGLYGRPRGGAGQPVLN